jgi:hypothetical protein
LITNIPLHTILFGPNIPAGMDLLTIGSLAWCLRRSSEPVDPPIDVTPEHGYLRVHDGRHRVIASIIAGRTHITANINGAG